MNTRRRTSTVLNMNNFWVNRRVPKSLTRRGTPSAGIISPGTHLYHVLRVKSCSLVPCDITRTVRNCSRTVRTYVRSYLAETSPRLSLYTQTRSRNTQNYLTTYRRDTHTHTPSLFILVVIRVITNIVIVDHFVSTPDNYPRYIHNSRHPSFMFLIRKLDS